MRHLQALSGWWRFCSEPFEVLLAVGALFVGPVVGLGLTAPTSLARQVSPWILHAWGSGLFTAAVITLGGRWLMAAADTDRAREIGARLEVLGLTVFVGTCTMYALSILAIGITGVPAGAFIAAFAAACAIRIRIVNTEWGHRRMRGRRARRPRDG